MHGLYAIVNIPHPHGLDLVSVTRGVLSDRLAGGEHGAAVVQLRAKAATTQERVEMLRVMAPLCVAAKSLLIVNDDLDAAAAGVPGVRGIHLGFGDAPAAEVDRRLAALGPEFVVGLSTHTPIELRAALARRPTYVGYGPVFPTQSKANPEAVVGLAGLAQACRVASVPVVAIGGLSVDTAARAVEVGASMVATIRALEAGEAAEIATRARSLSARIVGAGEPLDCDEVHRRVPPLSRQTLEDIARYADDLSIHIGLGLPARFHPTWVDGRALYRPSDVEDLLLGLGKSPQETWEDWARRGDLEDPELIPLGSLAVRRSKR